MRTSAKAVLTALAAGLLLACAVATASARNLLINNSNVRATWSSLEFRIEELGVTIRCPVTLEGSFAMFRLPKIRELLYGRWIRAVVRQESCTGGRVAAFNGVEPYNGTTTPNTLPWHWTYQSFTGSLPAFTAMQFSFRGFRWGLRDGSGICAGEYGTAEDAITLTAVREASGGITSLAPVEGGNNMTLFRRDGGLICPSPARMSGTGTFAQQGTTTKVTVTLI